MENRKKKINWKKYLFGLFGVGIGAALGFYAAGYAGGIAEKYRVPGGSLVVLLLLFLGIWAAFYVQLVIHEAGHLIFGLITGYRFSSFRIGSFMWVKEDRRLRFKLLKLEGTGGQCLMVPPEMKDGKIPYVLYNLGGVFTNMIIGLLFLALFFAGREASPFSVWWLMLAAAGFIVAAQNGIPMQLGTVNNDGYNAWSLGKEEDALRSFWIQLTMNEQMTRGVRLSDFPDEWFHVPSGEGMKNGMTAVVGVFACNRLMDRHEFEEAYRLMKELLEMESEIIGLHQRLLVADCIYCELVGQNRREAMDEMLDKQQKKFMKSMKRYPSVLRTEYAYALLAEGDTAKADEIKKQFEKAVHAYPYPGDAKGERELVLHALHVFTERGGLLQK